MISGTSRHMRHTGRGNAHLGLLARQRSWLPICGSLTPGTASASADNEPGRGAAVELFALGLRRRSLYHAAAVRHCKTSPSLLQHQQAVEQHALHVLPTLGAQAFALAFLDRAYGQIFLVALANALAVAVLP